MPAIHTRPKTYGMFLRLFAVFVSFWLWMLPQMLNARNTASAWDEYGTRPLPIAEEEEVKHTCATFAWTVSGSASPERSNDARPPLDERVEVRAHGDVAVPPPKDWSRSTR